MHHQPLKSEQRSDDAVPPLFQGSSHGGRGHINAFPAIASATGAYLLDASGARWLDLWQGHFSNILGHNSEVALAAIDQSSTVRLATQLGLPSSGELEFARLLCSCTGLETARFLTSGSQTTEYALRIARTVTSRNFILKGRGGWHGGNAFSLSGVRFPQGVDIDSVESCGLPVSMESEIGLFTYNDIDSLTAAFERNHSKVAAIILEPVVGNCGMYPVSPEFLRAARALASRSGAVFVADETVTAFRTSPGLFLQKWGITPDLACLGKIVGGGMPISALLGSHDLLNRAKRAGAFFEGGTYSAHPLSLAVGSAVVSHLRTNAATIYPRLQKLAEIFYERVTEVLKQLRVPFWMPQSAATMPFPILSVRLASSAMAAEDPRIRSVIGHWNHQLVDNVTRDGHLKQYGLAHGVHFWQGMGCLTAASTEDQVDFAVNTLRQFFMQERL